MPRKRTKILTEMLPNLTNMPKLTNTIIDAAIAGFEAQKEKIDAEIAALRELRSGKTAEPAAEADSTPKRRRRRISAAGRKAMAEAQRRRWATARGQSETKAPQAKKPRRKLSAAGRANIVAALKKRWAAKQAAAKKS